MKDLLLVLAGGVCSIVSSLATTWYHARRAGKIKLDEVIAERKVGAYGKGLELIGQLQFILLQGKMKEGLDFLYQNGSWFADNLILLPHAFVENWRSIRANLASSVLKDAAKEQTQEEAKKDMLVDDIVDSYGFCRGLAREAEVSIRDELGLPEFRTKHPQNTKSTQTSCQTKGTRCQGMIL